MTRRVGLKVNVEAGSAEEVVAALSAVLADLGEPVRDRGAPEPYEKIPGTWMILADLADQPGDDATEIMKRLTGRLALGGWHFEGDADVAGAVWGSETPSDVYAGVVWIFLESSHPSDGTPPETRDLVPDPPAGSLDPEYLAFLREPDNDGPTG
jgi:hypothetical protein